jgi:hypothetical protein
MKFFKALYDLFKKPKEEVKTPFPHNIEVFRSCTSEDPMYEVQVSNIEPIVPHRGAFEYFPRGVKFRLEISQGLTFKTCYDIYLEACGIWVTNTDYARKDEGEKIALKRYICAALHRCLIEHEIIYDAYQKFRISIPTYECLRNRYEKESKSDLKKDLTLKSIICQNSELFLVGTEVVCNDLAAKREIDRLTIKHVELKIWNRDRIKRIRNK